MSIIKSSDEHLTFNADGSGKSIKFQADGTEKASISSAGAFTSTTIDATKLTGDLPAISAAALTAIPAGNLTGTLPAISGANLTGVVKDTTTLENNIAMLGFYRASDNSKAKYSLVDQVIDEYTDATGIDAGNSTNESLTSGVYSGAIGSTGSKTFSYQGSNESWSVPSGVTSITVKSWGAGGSAGGYAGAGGSGGGYSTATFTVTAGTSMVGVVGQGGTGYNTDGSTPGTTGMYGGGGASAGAGASDGHGGLGGGLSGLFVGSYTQANAIIIAGGGGGGGYTGGGKVGGGGGGSTGNAGTGSYAGGGGTDSAGGAAGSGGVISATAGSALQGGTGGKGTSNAYWGAGGGGGYYGGGGASGTGPAGSSGAGGGSGFVRTSSFPSGVSASSSSTLTTGSNGSGGDGGAEANSADSDSSGAGGSDTGGNVTNANAENGALYVNWSAIIDNLTLQSTATTAESAPTTGDIVMLIEDAAGTATINTDIKAYISRDGSAFSSAVTLTDEGDWGTNKRILAAHNVDLSGITSGTSMKYKITTHNQSASKVTKIHATSLAWA
jgi:hypothetical protein